MNDLCMQYLLLIIHMAHTQDWNKWVANLFIYAKNLWENCHHRIILHQSQMVLLFKSSDKYSNRSTTENIIYIWMNLIEFYTLFSSEDPNEIKFFTHNIGKIRHVLIPCLLSLYSLVKMGSHMKECSRMHSLLLLEWY